MDELNFRVAIIPVKNKSSAEYKYANSEDAVTNLYTTSLSTEYTQDTAVVMEHYDSEFSTWVRDKGKRLKGKCPDYTRCDSCFGIIPEDRDIHLDPIVYDIKRPMDVCPGCYNSVYKYKAKSALLEISEEFVPSPPRSDNPKKKLICPICGHDDFDKGVLSVCSNGITRDGLRFEVPSVQGVIEYLRRLAIYD